MKKLKSILKPGRWQVALAGLFLGGTLGSAPAAQVTLTTSDALGSTSFNAAGHWSNSAAPSAANDYFTGAYSLRTPSSLGSVTFLGNSLTVNPGGFINMKGSGGAVMTVTNLILAGGGIGDGNGGTVYGIAGGLNVTANSGLAVANDTSRTIIVSSTIMGSSVISNGYTANGLGTIFYTNDNATAFSGTLSVNYGTVFRASSQTNLGGASAQLILDNGIFTPTASFAINNSGGGVTINPGGALFNLGSGLTLTINEPLSGTGALTNSGLGTLILNGNGAGYTGSVLVNSGTLALGASGSLPAIPAITVASGATFDVSATGGYTLAAAQAVAGNGTINGSLTDSSTSTISPGGTGSVGTLTLNNNLTLVNGGSLVYDFNATTNDLITVMGNLSPSGVTTFNLNSFPAGGLPNGTYNLITVAGTLGGSAANFNVLGLDTRKQYKIAYATSPNRVVLNVSGSAPASLVWTGDVTNGTANAWDLDTTTNWLIGSTPAAYFDADSVNFTDAGTNLNGSLNQPTLDLIVNPAVVTFNSASNYDLTSPTGLGSMVGSASVVQIGSGITTLAVSNAYSGGTLITNGVLQMGIQAALGNPAPTVPLAVITNSGALDLNSFHTDNTGTVGSTTNAIKIAGNGNTNGYSALYSSSGYMNLGYNDIGVNYIYLTGDTSIGGAGSTFQIGKTGLGIAGNNHVLTKVGGNTVYLFQPAVSACSSFVVAGGGYVFVNSPSAGGLSTPIVLTNGGWIDTWNPANWTGLTFANPVIVSDPINGGQINDNQGAYYGHVDYDTYNGNITLNGPLTFHSANTFGGAPNNVPTYGKITVNGVVSGTNNVIVAGGTANNIDGYRGGNSVVFAGNNTYTGSTMVSNLVQLLVNSASQASGPYDIVDNGTLDVALASGHPTFSVSSLTLDAITAGAGNLAFTRISSLSTTTPLVYATNLVINNGTIIPPTAGYQIGQFPLIQYSGTIGGNGFDYLNLGPLPNNVAATLVNNTANNSIDLLVTATGLVWTGTNSSYWDFSTANWLEPFNNTASTYADGDAVNFNDTTTNYVVNIPATIAPGGITVNTTSNYFFGGTAGISGTASLIKTGPGTLTVANSNNVFTGGTYINQGTIKLADLNYAYPYPGGALNDNLGVVTVASGGTLDVNGVQAPNYQSYGPDGYNVYIVGAGVNGNGALVNNNTSNNDNADAGYVTLTGNATVGGLGDVNVRHGAAPQLSSQSGAYTLTKVGPGQFRVRYNTVVSTNFGNINILQGVVSYESSNTNGFGDPTKTIFIGSGAGFALGTATAPFKKQIIASNNATIYCYGGGSVLATPVTLVGGTVTINANYFNAITFSNVLSGPAGITISYNSPVTFAAPNTYTGSTYVQDCNAAPGSILHLVGYGSITNSSGIQLQGTQAGQAYPGGLDVSGRVDGTLTLLNNQTFRGDNGSYVNGSVVATSGTTLTPGGLNNIQYFNVSNNVTLQAGSTVVADVSIDTGSPSNDVINVTGALTYGGTLQLNPSGTVPLTAGSAFKLFSFGSQSGNFATIAGSPGAGLGWTFNPATGVATVVQTIPSTPTNITFSVTGSTLNLSWPASYLGWIVQSNALNLSVAADWFDVPGTAAATSYSAAIQPGVTNVFYRLRHP